MTALVSFDRVFEVLDLPPMIDDKPDATAIPRGPAHIEFDHVDFGYPSAEEVSLASLESVAVLEQTPVAARCSSTCRSRPSPASSWRWWARRAPARRRSAISCHGSTTCGAARCGSTASTCATPRSSRSREIVGVVTQDAHLFHETIRRQPALRQARRHRRRAASRRCAPRRSCRWWSRCPTGSTRSSATAATGSRAARSSASPSPGCCSRRPTSSSSTRPPPTSTRSPRSPCSRRSRSALAGRTSLVIAHRLSTVREADVILVVVRRAHRGAGAPRRAARRRRALRRALHDPVRTTVGRRRHRGGRRRRLSPDRFTRTCSTGPFTELSQGLLRRAVHRDRSHKPSTGA